MGTSPWLTRRRYLWLSTSSWALCLWRKLSMTCRRQGRVNSDKLSPSPVVHTQIFFKSSSFRTHACAPSGGLERRPKPGKEIRASKTAVLARMFLRIQAKSNKEISLKKSLLRAFSSLYGLHRLQSLRCLVHPFTAIVLPGCLWMQKMLPCPGLQLEFQPGFPKKLLHLRGWNWSSTKPEEALQFSEKDELGGERNNRNNHTWNQRPTPLKLTKMNRNGALSGWQLPS